MKFGAGFSLGAMPDAAAVRDFAQTLDGAGFDYVTVGGHLLSVEANRYPERPNPTYVGPFHEPFVLFSYLAAITRRLAFRPSILILPMFQTAVVAKQAAELSFLSGGRFELGIGISWNPTEYQAMNQEMRTRGRRMEEQVEVLRRLWTEPFVSFEGRWHKLDRVGLNRLPGAPIPIWFGTGTDEAVLRRVAKLADGWIPLGDAADAMPKLQQYLREAGRDPAAFGLTARFVATHEGPAAWVESGKRLQDLGATHISITAPPDLAGPQALAQMVAAKVVLAGELG